MLVVLHLKLLCKSLQKTFTLLALAAGFDLGPETWREKPHFGQPSDYALSILLESKHACTPCVWEAGPA